jgi:NMD protein affecting ribosome stability and mRNA decay
MSKRLALLLAVVVLLAVLAVCWTLRAKGRYQVVRGVGEGVVLVDTLTGRTWHYNISKGWVGPDDAPGL